MGSLASRPKMPAVQTTVQPVGQMSAPAVAPPPPNAPVATASPAALSVASAPDSVPPSPAAVAEAVRKNGLLTRDRGILGTIQTSFRGILDTVFDQTTPRKKLLGE